MPQLSIVIPALGPYDLLEQTLVSVLENRPGDCEVVVVLNRLYDDPYALGDEVRFINAPRRARLVECVNAGIGASQAPLVHLLAAGAEVSESWTRPALRHFRDGCVAMVSPLLLDAAARQQVACAGLGYRREGKVDRVASGCPHTEVTDQALQVAAPSFVAGFYRKSSLAAVGGGFDAALGSCADVDLGLSLQGLGLKTVVEEGSKVYYSSPEQIARHGFRAALESERLFLRHLPKRGRIGSLAKHAWLVASEFAASLPRPTCVSQLLGRAVAWCSRGGPRCPRQQRTSQGRNTTEAAHSGGSRPPLADAQPVGLSIQSR